MEGERVRKQEVMAEIIRRMCSPNIAMQLQLRNCGTSAAMEIYESKLSASITVNSATLWVSNGLAASVTGIFIEGAEQDH